MAKPSARVVLNRSRLAALTVSVADGMAEVARTVLDTAEPPDATPFGAGLVTSGGYLVYVNGQKVAGYGQDGKQPKPPRAARVSKSTGVTVVTGYGFPGRFQEFGTVHHAPQPFFTPAVDRVLPHATAIIGSVTGPIVKRIA